MSKLSPRQEQAAQLLYAGGTVGNVAKAVGVTERTLFNWRKVPAFGVYLNQMREASQTAIQDSFRDTASRAVSKLGTLLESDDPAIALKAVTLVLTHLKPFESGTGIGSTDEDDLKPKNFLGIEITDRVGERIQDHLLILEDYLAGESTLKEVEDLMGVDGLTDSYIKELVRDHTKLMNLTLSIMASED